MDTGKRYENAVRWASKRYPQLWRDDPDEVRSCVGWALATGQRTEWVLSKELRRRGPVGRTAQRRHGTAPTLVEWDGRVPSGVGDLGSVAGTGHLVEWSDPTGEEAASRADAAAVLDAAHPEFRGVLWAWACGSTLAEIAEATGRPVHWVENVVYGRVSLTGRRAAEERREVLLDAVASGLARGRSLRSVAREQCCSDSYLSRLWRAHQADVGVAA